jgi:CubicO group peptidase (beta-lactamase class C family)
MKKHGFIASWVKLASVFIACLVFFSCSKKMVNIKDYSYSVPTVLNDHIPVKSINDYRIDTALIAKLNKDIIDENLYNVHSILIFKDNALFYEKYLCGKDQHHGRNLGIIKHDIYTLHDARSISKSIVSACIGIAIQKELIKSVDDPIKTYLSEFFSDGDTKSGITIKNLLTMSSGLLWKEMGNYGGLLNDETKMDLSFNPVRFILNKKLVSNSGTSWNYSAGNTQLLAEIIKRVSGKNVYQFAKENLFEPLGIKNSEWTNLALKREPAAASGLRLTSRDLLKFGMLYKDRGSFNGNRLLDSNWIEKTMVAAIERPDLSYLNIASGGYGYQFWTYTFTIKNKTVNLVEAKGNGGQSIFICEQLNLIVVLTAGNYSKVESNQTTYKIIKDYVLPSVL